MEDAVDNLRTFAEANSDIIGLHVTLERLWLVHRRSLPQLQSLWYFDENSVSTHLVGQKKANAWSLYDMYGNVWELCEDWFHETYNGAPTNGSAWLSDGEQKVRVVRGGSFDADVNISSGLGYSYHPTDRADDLGFRIVAIARVPSAPMVPSSGVLIQSKTYDYRRRQGEPNTNRGPTTDGIQFSCFRN